LQSTLNHIIVCVQSAHHPLPPVTSRIKSNAEQHWHLCRTQYAKHMPRKQYHVHVTHQLTILDELTQMLQAALMSHTTIHTQSVDNIMSALKLPFVLLKHTLTSYNLTLWTHMANMLAVWSLCNPCVADHFVSVLYSPCPILI